MDEAHPFRLGPPFISFSVGLFPRVGFEDPFHWTCSLTFFREIEQPPAAFRSPIRGCPNDAGPRPATTPSAYYEYPDNAYGYNYGVGFGTDALYAYAPRYGVRYRPAPLYDYAPGYSVGATAAPLYNFAPGYVSTVGYARGQSCRCSP